ncbi:MAG: Gfo/Idh/MocA family oxidoreductase [Desulfobacterales bacterium]|jgi:predicted dehydrogenase
MPTLDCPPHLRVAVIGVGYLGQYHAEKYARMEAVELVGVVDINADRAAEVAERHHTRAYTDFKDLIDKVDAVSIVTPTSRHFDIGQAMLEAGIHVLVEKPITTSLPEAQALVGLAESRRLVLQVGHLERFNPAVVAVQKLIHNPMFIEAHRLSIYQGRSTDVSVVLDLMIHDIDIILHFVAAEIKQIHASGAAVVSEHCDIANARIEFETGCVANITSSRISIKNQRKIRLFQKKGYISVDFAKREVVHIQQTNRSPDALIPGMEIHQSSFPSGDALEAELHSFADAVRASCEPVVTGHMGSQALAVALEVMDQIDAANRRFGDR